ncbi:MAG TPA: hypothetical protein VM452_19270 [Caulifigura sp.]|jgi:hypothetical protein|nr:hypothetical protein [Caulifigura sp.]
MFVASLLCGFPIAGEASDRWTSDDGIVGVTLPGSIEWLPIENPPAPLLMAWENEAGGVRLAIVKMAVPTGIRLAPEGLQEGLLEEIGGRITKSEQREVNGHVVSVMTAETTQDGSTMLVTQAVVQHGDHGYKAMALAAADDAQLVKAADDFIAGFEVLATPVARPADVPQDEGDALHRLSKRLGGWGVIALVVLLLLKRRRRSHPPATPARTEP